MSGKNPEINRFEEEREHLVSLANITGLLSHPIRLKIISILIDHEGASWTDISRELESILGRLNPNTINFHLLKLIIGGIVEKRGSDQYFIVESAKDDEVLKAALKKLKRGEV